MLIGGTLLLTPGFVTDFVGFFFILPFTRPITRAWLEAVVARRLLGPMGEWPGAPGAAGSAEARRRAEDAPTSSRVRSSRVSIVDPDGT